MRKDVAMSTKAVPRSRRLEKNVIKLSRKTENGSVLSGSDSFSLYSSVMIKTGTAASAAATYTIRYGSRPGDITKYVMMAPPASGASVRPISVAEGYCPSISPLVSGELLNDNRGDDRPKDRSCHPVEKPDRDKPDRRRDEEINTGAIRNITPDATSSRFLPIRSEITPTGNEKRMPEGGRMPR